MRSKSIKKANKADLDIHSVLKEHLMKDFSAPLASRIIEHNAGKHQREIKNIEGLAEIIKGILSDYQAINPVGVTSIAGLKKDLQNAVRRRAD